jgi:hypothetical protein
MSDVSTVMKFELIPNEIVMECFSYLNVHEIFHAFDQLNYRFYKLIRNIKLHLNLDYVRKSVFNQFCEKLLLNPEIKTQISSLCLSNKGKYDQINEFQSLFSINDFSRLRSLTLIQLKDISEEKLKSIISLIPDLHSLHLIECDMDVENELLDSLSASKLRTLSINSLEYCLSSMEAILSITNVTIVHCAFLYLSRFLESIPMIKYLNIEECSSIGISQGTEKYYPVYPAVHLKQLIIGNFKYKFIEFETFVKETPNLKSLTISTYYNSDSFDARRWEYLITSSLPYLEIFKFNFDFFCDRENLDEDIQNIFERFQTDFWHKQHQWYTEYSSFEDSLSIYTVPYISNTYVLKLGTDIHCCKFNSGRFDNVRKLNLDQQLVEEKCQYHFSNVDSLTLFSSDKDKDHFIKIKHIQILKRIVNLYNLKHLEISSRCKIETSSVLLQILKEAPQLSSISIDQNMLKSFLNDHELCKYLNQMIKTLSLCDDTDTSSWEFDNYGELRKLCDIFSNIEDFKCTINKKSDLLLILNQLPKLRFIKASLRISENYQMIVYWLKNELTKLNVKYDFDYYIEDRIIVNIWVD